MELKTIKQIKEANVGGNHFLDQKLWSECDRIIMDESKPFDLRLAASEKVDEIIGEEFGDGMNDIERVNKHLHILKELL